MRTIDVTTDVYAAIWGARQPGEDTEDVILRRVLKVTPAAPTGAQSNVQSGFRDPRFDIDLPEGFEIFRNHMGVEYRARATGGRWLLLNNGNTYATLNQLSGPTSGNTENAWRNWYFMGKDGKRHRIDGLRNDIRPNVRHLL